MSKNSASVRVLYSMEHTVCTFRSLWVIPIGERRVAWRSHLEGLISVHLWYRKVSKYFTESHVQKLKTYFTVPSGQSRYCRFSGSKQWERRGFGKVPNVRKWHGPKKLLDFNPKCWLFLTLIKMALLAPRCRMALNMECPCSASSPADPKILSWG